MASLEKDTLVICFFIGRLNPPHAGHAAALNALIDIARHDDSTPLILLGSGPKGERTLDNPVTFDTKRQILNNILAGKKTEIRLLSNPIPNVIDWTMEELDKNVHVTNVVVKLVAGNKLTGNMSSDGTPATNATKFNSVLKAIVGGIKKINPKLNVTSENIPITAFKEGDEDMSATRVRKDALGKTKPEFIEKHFKYYGEMAEKIYDEIAEIAEIVGKEAVEYYKETGEILKVKGTKSKSKSKGTKKATHAAAMAENENENEHENEHENAPKAKRASTKVVNKGASEPTGNAKHKPKTKRTVKVKTPSP